ncbi:sugar phosphate isomerase/epimerase family protein [Clostridium sp.]|uniref:sugar phosphate isomerase/epimerase family protein n=1 Tax=Clostridium sp. TaxID=1506 RepID=UPI00346455DF
MYRNKIGVIVDSFKIPILDGIKAARELGANGIQIYAVDGIMSPENLDKEKRKEILKYIRGNDLLVSALCGDLGGHGFTIEKDNKSKIEKSKRILDLALDLETRVVTTHIGVVPEDEREETYYILQEALFKLGEVGKDIGGYFAIETGPEKTAVLKNLLDSINTKGMKVNYDPANLVMVTDDDPVQGVYNLKDYIVHTHAKDGVMIKKTDPKIIYDYFAEGGIEDIRLEEYFKETPLGSGSVDFENYMNALKDISYTGFLTIEREIVDNPYKEISFAVDYLRGLL